MIKAADSSETFVYFYQMTLHNIMEDVIVIREEKCILLTFIGPYIVILFL